MRIIVSEFMSLDGVVQAPGGREEDTDGGFGHGGWSMPYFDADAMGSVIDEGLAATEALLFGRRTWQTMAHRMLCHIPEHGRGRPRRRLEVLGNLMGHTTTTTGWQMQAARETPTSPTGLKGREKALAAVQRTQAPFHGAWHYTISPR